MDSQALLKGPCGKNELDHEAQQVKLSTLGDGRSEELSLSDAVDFLLQSEAVERLEGQA